MLFFFPRGVLDEILNLIESVSEGFPSYFYMYSVLKHKVNRTAIMRNQSIKSHIPSPKPNRERSTVKRKATFIPGYISYQTVHRICKFPLDKGRSHSSYLCLVQVHKTKRKLVTRYICRSTKKPSIQYQKGKEIKGRNSKN